MCRTKNSEFSFNSPAFQKESLHNEEEFKAAMNVVAFVAFLFRDVRILTFEVMDNQIPGNKAVILSGTSIIAYRYEDADVQSIGN